MTSVLKNMYNDKLDYTVNKYNSKYSTIKMKLAYVKSNTRLLTLHCTAFHFILNHRCCTTVKHFFI